ncbi:MAG: DUF2812 domain-containing protein [Clostridia bacterium]|nr:DUF2812 domain-containing protein [Clostridia bacterium]
MKDIKRVWCSAFKTVVPEDYELWLEDMAAQGWHLDKIGQWSSILMTFKKGEPRKLRYVYDIQITPKKDYMEAYKQFGWEFVGQMASVYIWRMAYENERPEAFTDKESMRERSNRVLTAISISFVVLLLGSLALFVPQLLFAQTLTSSDRMQLIIAQIFVLLIALLLGGVMLTVRKSRNR